MMNKQRTISVVGALKLAASSTNDLSAAGEFCFALESSDLNSSWESVEAMAKRTYLEFFAGGGMARAGLGESWRCLFANDFDQMKVETYEANWGAGDIKHADVASLALSDLPPHAVDLAWASFPCQDLSLAGSYRGLGRDPIRDVLALLETDPGPGAGRTCPARNRS